MMVTVLVVLGLAGSAFGKLTGELKNFEQCPYANDKVGRCFYATTTGGEVALGSKVVPITNPVVIQGGYGSVGKDEFATKFFAAKNGVTLAEVPQPVPGGLAGVVPPDKSSSLVKAAIAFFFENGLTGVNATLELAKPASAIRISENHLAEETGIALEMPIKIHLENPFLGSECYVGSSSSPIIWQLTTGTTAPPAPNTPISGKAGELELLEGGATLKLVGTELVDNAWPAPAASGCGGFLSFLIDPMIGRIASLPAPASANTAVLESTIYEVPAATVKLNNEKPADNG
ncbi:MAG TPA: hypothetical protein VGC63_00040 [Solirubrobacterales bacterium]|jgi:hypothetical protein